MANLKEIRTRITSVESTMQITSAMKMVSAAKLKRAQDAITQMRPFAKKFNEILLNQIFDLIFLGFEFLPIFCMCRFSHDFGPRVLKNM